MSGTSMPRNQFLFTNANFLLPYTGAGSGILRAMEDKPNVTFENRESAHEFVITIKREPAVDDQVSDQVANGETNGETNGGTNQVMHQVTHQVSASKHRLTKVQKDIVNFCSIPRSAKEILDRLNLSNQTFNRKRYIQPLVEMGVLEMTIPENPNDRNQKYRKKR